MGVKLYRIKIIMLKKRLAEKKLSLIYIIPKLEKLIYKKKGSRCFPFYRKNNND